MVQHEDDNGRHTAVMDRAKGHRIRGGGSSGIARGDFNGDGFADLAVGIPAKRVSGLQNAGAVVVIYGSANGRRERRAVPGSRPTAWNFGRDETILIGTPPITFPLVVKATDLAIGAPDKAVNGVAGAGTVTVLYGSVIGDGLVTTNSQSWAEGQTGIPTTPSAFDGFGAGIY